MDDKFETLGQIIDEIDSLAHGLVLPLNPSIHVQQLKISLPEKVAKLKRSFEEITGENLWSTN